MFSFLKKLRFWSDTELSHHEVGSELFFYPPPEKEVPLVAPEKILQAHNELVMAIRQNSGMSIEKFNAMYVTLLESFIDFVHLLPASELHHHKLTGGLVRHSLEVAYFSIEYLKNYLLGHNDSPGDRYRQEPSVRFAIFARGLLHDIGKCFSDVEVIFNVKNLDGENIVWNPRLGKGLYSFGKEIGASSYKIRFRPNRVNKHIYYINNLTGFVLKEIHAAEISKLPRTLYEDYCRAMSTTEPMNTNSFHLIISQSDSKSTIDDLRGRSVYRPGFILSHGHRIYDIIFGALSHGVLRSVAETVGASMQQQSSMSILIPSSDRIFVLRDVFIHYLATELKQGGIVLSDTSIYETLIEHNIVRSFGNIDHTWPVAYIEAASDGIGALSAVRPCLCLNIPANRYSFEPMDVFVVSGHTEDIDGIKPISPDQYKEIGEKIHKMKMDKLNMMANAGEKTKVQDAVETTKEGKKVDASNGRETQEQEPGVKQKTGVANMASLKPVAVNSPVIPTLTPPPTVADVVNKVLATKDVTVEVSEGGVSKDGRVIKKRFVFGDEGSEEEGAGTTVASAQATASPNTATVRQSEKKTQKADDKKESKKKSDDIEVFFNELNLAGTAIFSALKEMQDSKNAVDIIIQGEQVFMRYPEIVKNRCGLNPPRFWNQLSSKGYVSHDASTINIEGEPINVIEVSQYAPLYNKILAWVKANEVKDA